MDMMETIWQPATDPPPPQSFGDASDLYAAPGFPDMWDSLFTMVKSAVDMYQRDCSVECDQRTRPDPLKQLSQLLVRITIIILLIKLQYG